MTANVIDIADYRRRKLEATRPVSQASTTATVTFWPMFCAFGWVLVPVVVPGAGLGSSLCAT